MRFFIFVALNASVAMATVGSYMAKHLAEHHGITDTADATAFLQLHDTNNNQHLDQSELAHFYMLYHGKEGDEAGFKAWFDALLAGADLNKDGKISLDELRRPVFEDRLFSWHGKGGAIVASNVIETSAWRMDSGFNRVDKDGHVQYHNIPAMFRSR